MIPPLTMREAARKADLIDANPPDSAASTRVHLDAEISSTTAVHVRGALLGIIQRADPDAEELWMTWPLRRMINVLTEALGDAVQDAASTEPGETPAA